MAKKRNKSERKRMSVKLVQATEDLPPPPEILTVEQRPEIETEPWEDDGLTLKQRRFCLAYVGEAAGNATKAAKLAGYRDDNTVALAATGSENLRKPQIRSRIGQLLAASGASPDALKNRLAQIAQSSLDSVMTINEKGEVDVDLKQAAAMGALGQIKEFREETIELGDNVVKRKRTVKMHDPLPAIRTLLEIHGKITNPTVGVSVHIHQVSDDDLVTIAQRGSIGTAQEA